VLIINAQIMTSTLELLPVPVSPGQIICKVNRIGLQFRKFGG